MRSPSFTLLYLCALTRTQRSRGQGPYISGPQCVAQTSSISINWELGRNGNTEAQPNRLSQEVWVRGPAVWAVTGPRGGPGVPPSLRTAATYSPLYRQC